MKKALKRIWDNILFIETLFLLIFIPLYPKLPLLDVKNTWVYIRAEDFIVFAVLISWLILLFQKRITLKTPLTIPIMVFWLIGAIATIHGILLIFPTISNAHSNVAFFSLVRHIEYISLFFIAFFAIQSKKQLNYVIATLAMTLTGVILYGFGQRFLGFPAYLTMNEEFAKGIPIQLSELSRVPSTFAGHYDLAAYLVLIVPILFSLIFGIKNIFVKIGLGIISALSIVLMFMTVSRVSFVVLFISFFIVLFFQKRKLVFLSIPLIIIFGVVFLSTNSSILDRFSRTVSEVQVLVDAETGGSLGHVEYVTSDYFKDKTVITRPVEGRDDELPGVTVEDRLQDKSYVILPPSSIPETVPLVKAVNISNGEILPQGTGYINLYLSPVEGKPINFYYELPPNFVSSPSAQVMVVDGDFLIKRASAYDLSFTTRFQGEWPNAIEAFKKNILVGSGYGSVSLAIDNNYLRILAEIGLVGFISFFLLFITLAIYIKRIYPDIDSKVAKAFILGFGAGVVGLLLNAILIDVFEASKVAFSLWLLFGIVISTLTLYQKKSINLLEEFKNLAISNLAIIVYLGIFAWVLFSPIINNYFVADDFTWLRWAADGSSTSNFTRVIGYFTSSDGFFYRPGTKLYFLFMYEFFWLNQVIYHSVSILLHIFSVWVIFALSLKLFRSKMLAALSALFFLLASGAIESINWISASGHLANSLFILLALLLFIYWNEKKKIIFYIGSIIFATLSLFFHEAGVVVPILIFAYILIYPSNFKLRQAIRRIDLYAYLLAPVIYLAMRFSANSHWTGGDYSYDLVMLPLNFIGNLFGYFMLGLAGPFSLSLYSILREITRSNILIAFVILPIAIGVLYFLYKISRKIFSKSDIKTITFALSFSIITLLPFLGLGNIAPRYSYLASFGVIIILVLFLRVIYKYLIGSGKETAVLFLTLIIIVFSIFHIIQIQQSYSNWGEAGNRTKNFFIAIQKFYSNEWSGEKVDFHFVNVPTKIGDAWIFPVGIEDAVWLAFRNENARIILHSDNKEALDQAGLYRSRPVFIFNPDGSVVEVNRFKNIPLDLILP